MAEYKFLDDLAKFGNSTISAMGGFQKQASKWVAEQTTSLVKGMDLVTKQEYKEKIAELEERIAKLEGKAESRPAKTATPKAKKAE